MIAFNKCPKCKGALRLHTDPYGTFFTCLMCGAHVVAKCPHCKTRSIQVGLDARQTVIECRKCGCVNRELVAPECEQVAATV